MKLKQDATQADILELMRLQINNFMEADEQAQDGIHNHPEQYVGVSPESWLKFHTKLQERRSKAFDMLEIYWILKNELGEANATDLELNAAEVEQAHKEAKEVREAFESQKPQDSVILLKTQIKSHPDAVAKGLKAAREVPIKFDGGASLRNDVPQRDQLEKTLKELSDFTKEQVAERMERTRKSSGSIAWIEDLMSES